MPADTPTPELATYLIPLGAADCDGLRTHSADGVSTTWTRDGRLLVGVTDATLGSYQLTLTDIDVDNAAVTDSGCREHADGSWYGQTDCATCAQERRDRISYLATNGFWSYEQDMNGQLQVTITNKPTGGQLDATFTARGVRINTAVESGPCRKCGGDVFRVSATMRSQRSHDHTVSAGAPEPLTLASSDRDGAGSVHVECARCGAELAVHTALLELI